MAILLFNVTVGGISLAEFNSDYVIKIFQLIWDA